MKKLYNATLLKEISNENKPIFVYNHPKTDFNDINCWRESEQEAYNDLISTVRWAKDSYKGIAEYIKLKSIFGEGFMQA